MSYILRVMSKVPSYISNDSAHIEKITCLGEIEESADEDLIAIDHAKYCLECGAVIEKEDGAFLVLPPKSIHSIYVIKGKRLTK